MLSIDVGVEYEGWVADAALTVALRPVTPTAARLLKATRESLEVATEQAVPGNRLGDVSHAVQERVETRRPVGDPLAGRPRDRAPDARGPAGPNFGEPGRGMVLEEGMVFCVEPMVCAGGHAVRMGDDNWAIYSQDGSLTAHFEHTIAVTAEGPRILTPWHLKEDRAAA